MYYDGATPHLRMPADRYQLVKVGSFDLYVPLGS